MWVSLCKSKIHQAVVTDLKLHYEGSITIDRALMEAAHILPYERVQVLNINTGARAETYVIEGEANSGTIELNGALARLAQRGDQLIIIAYALMSPEEARDFRPVVVLVDDHNRIKSVLK